MRSPVLSEVLRPSIRGRPQCLPDCGSTLPSSIARPGGDRAALGHTGMLRTDAMDSSENPYMSDEMVEGVISRVIVALSRRTRLAALMCDEFEDRRQIERGTRLMTLSTSAVAVCCRSNSSRSRVLACTSSNRRTFSMAMTAWSAKVGAASSAAVKGRGSVRVTSTTRLRRRCASSGECSELRYGAQSRQFAIKGGTSSRFRVGNSTLPPLQSLNQHNSVTGRGCDALRAWSASGFKRVTRPTGAHRRRR